MMKRLLLLIVLLPLALISCTKELSTSTNEDEEKEESFYYIQYKAWTLNSYGQLSGVSFKNEHGKMVSIADDGVRRTSFEIIIGPVPFGFECEIRTGNYSDKVRIDCSKNNSPFAFKAEGNENLSYKIEY